MNFLWNKDPFKDLKRKLGKNKVITAPETLRIYSVDASRHRGSPDVVVFVEDVDDIQATIEFARENDYSITPRGAGSGLSGGAVPIEGGIVLSCERMKTIEHLHVESKIAIVQPGVVTETLQREAAKYNLFYPPDPSSYKVSTIGGNVAENAGGLRCFKYGVTSHYTLGLEYVDYEGEIRQTGNFGKSINEPDFTGLLVGSEGALGIFSRIQLRLIEAPEKTITIRAFLAGTDIAFAVVQEIINERLTPSIIEFLDRKTLEATISHIGSALPANVGSMLLVEVDGTEEEAEASALIVQDIFNKRALEIERADDQQLRKNMWELRRAISPSLIRLASGKIHEDISVPRSKLRELAKLISKTSEDHNLKIALYGHAGDGNLHVVILFNADNVDEAQRAEQTSREIFQIAIDLGGSITGEHGVGLAKREFLGWQLSDNVMKLSRKVKRSFDRDELFNPGKIFTSL